MSKDIKTLEKLAAAHASTRDHFNHRVFIMQFRPAVLAEWCEVVA